MKSIRSVYKIGHGPSSSHTVGPYRAARIMGQRYPEADAWQVTLYGSLAFTGEGHGTGKAIQAALPGAEIIFNRAMGRPETYLKVDQGEQSVEAAAAKLQSLFASGDDEEGENIPEGKTDD